MRIALIQETFKPFIGGSAKRAYEVFRRLAKKGHEVHVYTVRLNPSWPPNEQIDGMTVQRITTGPLITRTAFRYPNDVLKFSLGALQQLIRNNGFDIYETSNSPIFPSWSTRVCAKLRSKPLSVTVHECWHKDWFKWATSKPVACAGIISELLTAQMASLLVAVSDHVKQRLVDRLSIPPERIAVISNGVDPNLLRTSGSDRKRFKIIYVGRLYPHKRVDLLLRAYSKVKSDFLDASLDIIGAGAESCSLMRLADQLNLKDVHFKGVATDEELVRALASAWAMVLPSEREGQSIVVLESMAAGTPVIAARAEGSAAASIIDHGENGLVAESTPDSIATQIKRLFLDGNLWKHIAYEGRRRVRNLTWDKIAEQYDRLYEELTR